MLPLEIVSAHWNWNLTITRLTLGTCFKDTSLCMVFQELELSMFCLIDGFPSISRMIRCLHELHWTTEAADCLKVFKNKYPSHAQNTASRALEKDIDIALATKAKEAGIAFGMTHYHKLSIIIFTL